LSRLLQDLVDPRSGKPLVAKVLKIRASPDDHATQSSAADLIVVWREGVVTDVAEHPSLGRIGPVPFFRTGGHSTLGFMLAVGEGFAPGVRLPRITTPDFTATLLAAMGVAIPAHVQGRPLQELSQQPS
jgi:hypothetical protein